MKTMDDATYQKTAEVIIQSLREGDKIVDGIGGDIGLAALAWVLAQNNPQSTADDWKAALLAERDRTAPVRV